MKLTNCGITIDVSAIEAPRYKAAGYVEAIEPVQTPAQAQPEPEAEQPKARRSAKKKG